MQNLTKHVQNENALYDLWDRGDVLVIGLSGGRDSMCLLDVMHRIAQKADLTLIAAHVNYGLRAGESDRDMLAVQTYCDDLGVSCEVHSVTTDKSNATEATWRDIRYDFFADVAVTHGARTILTAHHQDDQAETLLLHLLRGSGLRGLRGILPLSTRGDLRIARPFLHVPRTDIDRHILSFAVPYRDDVSNQDSQFTRNRIRNDLLPLLTEQYNPQIISSLAYTAESIQAEMSSSSLPPFWDLADTGTSLTFSRTTFLTCDYPTQIGLLRHFYALLTQSDYDAPRSFALECRKVIVSTKNKHQQITVSDLILTCKNDIVELALL